VPEIPEIQAHAERLDAAFAGRVLERFTPLGFTVLKTAAPPPEDAHGHPLRSVGRRGKYLLLELEPLTFVVHLMQGGRLLVVDELARKPRGGQARFLFAPAAGGSDGEAAVGGGDRRTARALLLTEQGSERRAGVWCVAPGELDTTPPLAALGPEAVEVSPTEMAELFTRRSMRIHGFLRDQHVVAGLGRRLANEVCHRARVSPFATTGRLGPDDAERIVDAIRACVAEDLEYERSRPDMSSSKERPRAVHGRTGEACPVCGDTVRAVEYSGYTVHYCPTCQTGGRILADNTTSKFLK
jgi:formamidopyrimidine-DNA glycosylase